MDTAFISIKYIAATPSLSTRSFERKEAYRSCLHEATQWLCGGRSLQRGKVSWNWARVSGRGIRRRLKKLSNAAPLETALSSEQATKAVCVDHAYGVI
jgi:hypothetical protein